MPAQRENNEQLRFPLVNQHVLIDVAPPCIAALESGLSVPGDLAVTSYDNDRIGEFPAMGLTTAEQDLHGICTTGVRTLIERINNPVLPTTTKSFDSKLQTSLNDLDKRG